MLKFETTHYLNNKNSLTVIFLKFETTLHISAFGDIGGSSGFQPGRRRFDFRTECPPLSKKNNKISLKVTFLYS